MLVVLASNRDSVAARLVEQWSAHGAQLLTSRDLSRAGWRYRPGAAARSTAVLAGERVRAKDIEGVVVRMPFVDPEELGHIQPIDRQYVAQEMNAMLTAWLTELPCKVVNRPSAECLGGPGWGIERWRHAAAAVGLTVRARSAVLHTVTIVGERSLGNLHLDPCARRLAEAAGVNLLEVQFDAQDRFVGVDPWPDLSRLEVGEALLEWFGA